MDLHDTTDTLDVWFVSQIHMKEFVKYFFITSQNQVNRFNEHELFKEIKRRNNEENNTTHKTSK